MTSNRYHRHMKVAIPARRKDNNDLAMTHGSPPKTSHAPTASHPSASAHAQLPLHTEDSFQKEALRESSHHNNQDTSVEHPTPTAHSNIDGQQQDKPHQHTVAEQLMKNPAMAYPRTQEQQVNSSCAQSGIDYPTREQLLEDLKRTKLDLREREEHLIDLQIRCRTDLAIKDQHFYSLQEQVQTKLTAKDQELKDLTERFRAGMVQKDRDADNIRQMWKQAAKELGKYQAQDNVTNQVTDLEVTQKARYIQYIVRNFTYQHFGGEINTGKSVQGFRQYLQKHLQIPTDFFAACMNSPVKRPMLVSAVLWDFLVKDVFKKNWWVHMRVHRETETLTDTLKPFGSGFLADWSKAKRRYQMWKASTSALLVDALKSDREKGQGMSPMLRDKVQDLCTQLGPLTKSKYEDFATQILDIVDEALDLDQLFSKQVADIDWTMGADNHASFNEASMELQFGERRSVNGQKVQLVVAPGLVKLSRSTWGNYAIESILLRMTVSCELITTNNTGESHKPPRDSSKPGAVL